MVRAIGGGTSRTEDELGEVHVTCLVASDVHADLGRLVAQYPQGHENAVVARQSISGDTVDLLQTVCCCNSS
jgi:hypothetical protein